MTEITDADCNVAEYIAGDRARDVDYQVVAHYRNHARMEERAAIVAWLRQPTVGGDNLEPVCDTHTQIASAIEAGEHLK